jgi:MFS superfamily sulfate permease-like transporter
MALGNILSGFLGGLPCTGVLVRTSVNITSGATNKISQMINSIVVLIIVISILPVFSYIPMAVIASVLINSSLNLIPFKYMVGLFK